MRTNIKNRFLLPALIAALAVLPARPAAAQTFTALHGFALEGFDNALDMATNSDGSFPDAGLVLAGSTLYGTASFGGTNGTGTVFAINTDGSGFTNLYAFSAPWGTYPNFYNRDGYGPAGSLILSGNMLYGTASEGGTNGTGTVFALNTNGTGFSILHTFTAIPGVYQTHTTNRDGAFPVAGLILSGTTLFGTAANGGTNGCGTVFALNLDGSGFTNLHNFSGSALNAQGQGGFDTNSDGFGPSGSLVLAGNTLYGTAEFGGTNGTGTVFALNTDGTGFTALYHFTAADPITGTNRDGAAPKCGLILSGNTLYGTAGGGGTNGTGTVFALNTNGADFVNLHDFMALPGNHSPNGDGANPTVPLVLSGGTLYGTARGGGTNGMGAMFALRTDGTGFTNLYNFTAKDPITGTNRDGAGPNGGLILSGKTLYGTAYEGGTNDTGTVFSLALAPVASPPQLAITLSGTNVVLTWAATGFTLQSATNLTDTFSNVSGATSPYTNAIISPQTYFRLKGY